MTTTPSPLTPAVAASLRIIRLSLTAQSLHQALRAACTPLLGVGMKAAQRGRIWAQLSPAGQLRFTTQWGRQWARSYAQPLSVQLPTSPTLSPRPLAQLPGAPVIPPLALTLDDVSYLVDVLESRLIKDETTVWTSLHTGGLTVSRIGERRWTGFAAHRAQGDQEAPSGPFPFPTLTAGPSMPSGALAALVGVHPRTHPGCALHLHPVPDAPTLTAWTLGDWAHGRSYLPPALRARPATLRQTLAAREHTTA